MYVKIIVELARAGGALTERALSKKVKASRRCLERHVERLEKLGLVRKVVVSERFKVIELSSELKRALDVKP